MKLALCPVNNFVLLERVATKKEEKKGSIILPHSEEEVTYIVRGIGENVSANLGIGSIVLLSYSMHEELPVDKKYGDNLVLVKQEFIVAYEYNMSEKTKEN